MEGNVDLSGATIQAFQRLRDAKELPETATHLLMSHSGMRMCTLWRLSDGLMLGEGGVTVALWGDNPNRRESRVFIHHDFVRQYLKAQLPEGSEVFEHDMATASKIIIPETFSADLASNYAGTVRKLN